MIYEEVDSYIRRNISVNGTDEDLIGSFTYSDGDSDAISNNQTKWFRDDAEQTGLADLMTYFQALGIYLKIFSDSEPEDKPEAEA